jgi:glutathione S-transferase
LNDFNQHGTVFFLEKDPAKKAELINKFKTDQVPKYLKTFEEKLAKNGTGFLVGGSMTAVDIYLFDTVDNLVALGASLDSFPKVKALHEKVKSVPAIAEWVQKRPKTDF